MARNCYRYTVLVMVALIGVVGHGAEPADLIARLKKLDAGDTIHATVHIEDRTSRTEDENSKPLEKGDFVVTAEPNALTVAVTGKIQDSRVSREFSLLRAGELAHCAPHLAKGLDGLKLIENRAGSYLGVSCRHWRLEAEEKQKRFGFSSTTVKDVELWIDSDGYPIAGVFKTQAKGKMLLFNFSAESVRRQRYQRVGTRLVMVLDKNQTDMSSKAGKEKRTIVTTVKFK
ncbi:MAG TPA: hypothetical protein ENI81_07200 [Phycisphaerales bacterium]|nr:hypothetical protein [Phycisphaerales bacterium]